MLQPEGLELHVEPLVHDVLPALGHVFVPHAPVPQLTSHAHAWSQVIAPHAFGPLQVIAHWPCELFPQSMSPHAAGALQSIVHEAASVQSIDPHAPGFVHVMLQCMSPGQWMLSPPFSEMLHVGGEVLMSQPRLQRPGQAPLSTTQ